MQLLSFFSLLEPERAGVLEDGHELAGDVDGHEPVEPPEEPPADEHNRKRRDLAVHGEGGELGFVGDLVHGGVHPEPLQQPLHHVAQAAPAHPHHHHRALRHRPPHRLAAVVLPRRRCPHDVIGRAGGLRWRLRTPRPRRQPPGAVRDGLVHLGCWPSRTLIPPLAFSSRRSLSRESPWWVFSEDLFFIYLLPPIIFNAGFQVKKKQFFRNFMTITLFAVVGTLISFSIISLGAMGIISKLNIGALELGDYLALGAIFSATDSVCTLQVLSQDETPFLYSLVFGEGVVNDATSVVLFNAIQNFDLADFSSLKFLQFIGNFLYLFGASTFLGVATGLLSAYVIKKLYFGRHSTDREVAIMMLMAYLSYMLAELLDLSGILTVFFCGILMSHYTWHNVTESSRVTTKHAFATLSFISETFLFLYVGMDALDIEKWKIVSETYSPMKSIALSSIILVLVLVARAAFVFPLSYLSNLTKKTPSEKISIRQQVIIWWAGLMRGAVSIALAYNKFAKTGHTQLPSNAIMITSTITIVLFSTIVFGLLTKPLIRLLIPARHLTREVSALSEPSSPKSFLEQLPVNGTEADLETGAGIRRPTSLRMLLASPTRSVHHYWRKFDNAFMRPVFGGRGFVPFVPGSPTESSVPLLAPGSEN